MSAQVCSPLPFAGPERTDVFAIRSLSKANQVSQCAERGTYFLVPLIVRVQSFQSHACGCCNSNLANPEQAMQGTFQEDPQLDRSDIFFLRIVELPTHEDMDRRLIRFAAILTLHFLHVSEIEVDAVTV